MLYDERYDPVLSVFTRDARTGRVMLKVPHASEINLHTLVYRMQILARPFKSIPARTRAPPLCAHAATR